jgi:hypothetical protein
MSGAGLPRATCSVDSVTANDARRPAASSTVAISDGGEELASPSGQRPASSRTAATAPGSSGSRCVYRSAMCSMTSAATRSGGRPTPRSWLR